MIGSMPELWSSTSLPQRVQLIFQAVFRRCSGRGRCVAASMALPRRGISPTHHQGPSMNTVTVDKLHVPDAILQAWPLPPELVIEGHPQASGAVLSRSDDARKVRGIW